MKLAIECYRVSHTPHTAFCNGSSSSSKLCLKPWNKHTKVQGKLSLYFMIRQQCIVQHQRTQRKLRFGLNSVICFVSYMSLNCKTIHEQSTLTAIAIAKCYINMASILSSQLFFLSLDHSRIIDKSTRQDRLLPKVLQYSNSNPRRQRHTAIQPLRHNRQDVPHHSHFQCPL